MKKRVLTVGAVLALTATIVTAALAAYLFLRTPGHSARAALVPKAEDLQDYVRLARRSASTLGRRRFRLSQ